MIISLTFTSIFHTFFTRLNIKFFGDIMAKDKSFAAKIAKASGATSMHCPECGEVKSPLFVVTVEKNEAKGSKKFRESFLAMCKCNQNELMN